jgi:hypothetical protein
MFRKLVWVQKKNLVSQCDLWLAYLSPNYELFFCVCIVYKIASLFLCLSLWAYKPQIKENCDLGANSTVGANVMTPV